MKKTHSALLSYKKKIKENKHEEKVLRDIRANHFVFHRCRFSHSTVSFPPGTNISVTAYCWMKSQAIFPPICSVIYNYLHLR